MDEVNYSKCQSIKNKNDFYHQCPKCKKSNEKFCGIHLKNKKRLLYIDFYNEYNNKKICQNVNEINYDINNDSNCETNYDINELLYKIQKNDNIKINYIRNVIKKSFLKSHINTKQSKKFLIDDVKKYIERYRFYENNSSYIIIIQKYTRRWLVNRRSICFNDEDILYMINKYEIENKFFYQFKDCLLNRFYAYDIRSLKELINSGYPSCPYTLRLFNNEEIMNINKYINKLKKLNIDLSNNIELSEEEENIKNFYLLLQIIY